jgi:hypothetical protein
MGLAPTARATSLDRPMNLAALVSKSSVIVTGTVTEVTTGRLGNTAYVEVALEVGDAIRGATPGATLRFRQLNLAEPRPPEDGRLYVGVLPGVPHYPRGERVLLFLGKEGTEGFRTTVGLQQGKFVFSTGNVQSEAQNQGLFDRLNTGGAPLSVKETAMLATRKGAVGADTFVSFLERAVAGNWWGAPTSGPGGTGGAGGTGGGDQPKSKRPVAKE